MKTIVANKSWLAESDLRLDASFHLSDGRLTIVAFKKANIETRPLHKVTEKIFYGGRARRVYVKNKEYGLPFIKGADIVKSDFSSLKILSRKRTANLNEYFLEEGWTLITRSGTIGNTAYVNKDFINKAASDDIIRVIPKTLPSGFLYAFLSSKQGQALIKNGMYGAVIQHIEPEHIANIPIPIFSTDKQEEIHSLIVEAAKLRVDANRLLEEAHKKLSSELLLIKPKRISNSFSIKTINQSHTERFESSYYLSIGRDYIDQILSRNKYTYLKDVTSDIFRPGIFKRVYVNNNGITFLGGADIVKANPNSDKKLSKKTKGIEKLKLKKDWILCTCGGTIGNVVYVDSEIAKCTASQHILRLIPNEKIQSGYLYALLSSEIGNEMIKSYTYGSVIPQIEPHHIELLPIPKIKKETENEIHYMVMNYVHYLESAKQLESKAIQLVETEIDQWQQ